MILPDPRGEHDLTPAATARLCDRRAGIGADGVLRVVRTAALPGPAPAAPGETGPAPTGPAETGPAEWFMDYRNADGSVAEMCGNGVRVFARYLLEHGLAAGPSFAVATRSGIRQVRVEPDGQISVDMGPATVLGPGRAVIGGVIRDGLRVSVGNPHLACLVDDALDKFDLAVPPGLDPARLPGRRQRGTGPADRAGRHQHAGARAGLGRDAILWYRRGRGCGSSSRSFSATKTAPRQWHVRCGWRAAGDAGGREGEGR